ncbi:hypothetical protein [Dysgonomonas sp. 511]|uniref:gliding motility lipoprotein GldB n=1 Tax=Dysgonomonas sp. 511 TaxID=2302930 RepID=UPI0013CFBBD1|nr:hypothetical protein [Dysgonomonas sp. 511]NDV78187.1 hypothetical protein [Dysgonomonas sp. 511]
MKKIIYPLLFVIISFVGCSGTIKRENAPIGEKQMKIERFDKDIYAYLQHPDSIAAVALKEKYPLLLPAFGHVAMGNSDPTVFFASLEEYFSHPMLMQIYNDALARFGDLSIYEKELADAGKLAGQHFSGKSLPQLAMHVSGFRENVIVLSNLISLSSDKYLGSGYDGYREFFQPYERQQMQAKYITRDYLRAWLLSDIMRTDEKHHNMLEAMVAEGKVLYVLSELLPSLSEDDIIGYTGEQMDWCRQNENMIWQKMVKKYYVYSIDNMVMTRFINDAPSTSLISAEAPGRLGAWIGWQMIKKYKKEKKNFSVMQIVNADALDILKTSKYNP